MKKIIAVSGLVLMIGVAGGCSSEKTTKNSESKTESVQKEKELVAKDIFKKATEEFKKEEYVTMAYDMAMKGTNKSEDMKMKIQMQPKAKSSRSEMNVSGTEIIVFEVDGKIVGQVKNPNTGELMTIPNEQLNTGDLQVTKNILEDADLPAPIANKMKADKDGDKYKLILSLKGKEAIDALQKMNGNMKNVFEGLNLDSLNVEYIITKDFKFEAFKVDMKVSANKEEMKAIIGGKITSYEKFDPIKLPELK